MTDAPDQVWVYCADCGPRSRFELTLPDTIHCADCGRIVGETATDVHATMAAFEARAQLVVDAETGERLSGIVWDDGRIQFENND